MHSHWRVPDKTMKLLAMGLVVCFAIVITLGLVRESHPGQPVGVIHGAVKVIAVAIAVSILAGALLRWRQSRGWAAAVAVVMSVLGVAALVAFQVIAGHEGPDSADIGGGALVPLGVLLSVAAALTGARSVE